jgi:hypothetical protein
MTFRSKDLSKPADHEMSALLIEPETKRLAPASEPARVRIT